MSIISAKYVSSSVDRVVLRFENGTEFITDVQGTTWVHQLLDEWLYSHAIEPWKTTEELVVYEAEQARKAFKEQRTAAVNSIVVEVDSLLFDGDEVAQGRMSRAALVMQDNETTIWVQANNEPAIVTRAQLIEAIRLAGAEQTRLWVQP